MRSAAGGPPCPALGGLPAILDCVWSDRPEIEISGLPGRTWRGGMLAFILPNHGTARTGLPAVPTFCFEVNLWLRRDGCPGYVPLPFHPAKPFIAGENMSLEIAAVCDRFAIVVSDGLAWDASGRVTDEHSQKQIMLGGNIVIAAGGYVREVEELFSKCQTAYNATATEKLAAVRAAFEQYIGSKLFRGFGETILSGLLVARQEDGFLLIKKRGNYDREIRFIKPGDPPTCAYLTPTGRVKAVCFLHEHQAILGPLLAGATPNQIIANLRALFHAAAESEDPPKLNENLRIAVVGDVPAGEPAEPDVDLVLCLGRFVEQIQEVFADAKGGCTAIEAAAKALLDNAINADNIFSSQTPQSVTGTEKSVATVNVTPGHGVIEVYAQVLASALNTDSIIMRIYKDSLAGTAISYGGSIPPGEVGTNLTLDQTPTTGTYVLGAYSSGTQTINGALLMAGNRKK